MGKRNFKRLTFDDLLPSGSPDHYILKQDQKTGKPLIRRNGKDISISEKSEMYLNETELKKKGIEFLQSLPRCKILDTDNMALRVGNGRKAKTRNPGMSDHHICLNGYFVAIEAKMPGKDLDPDQVIYRDEVLAANGIYIVYHSVSELISEMKKHQLINKRTV